MSIERIVASPVELATLVTERVAVSARKKRLEGRRLSLVLPGGSVAQAFFPVLSASQLDWDCVDLFWGDERAVPPDDSESNYRLAETLLLSRLHVDPPRVHRMAGESADLEQAACDYETEIARVLGEPARFDIVLLGVGPDGHVCSLFPGHPALDVTSRRVVVVTDAPKPPPTRLTLTLAALGGADILVAAFGATKAAVVTEALEQPDSLLPVAQAARVGRSATFLLDPDAASV